MTNNTQNIIRVKFDPNGRADNSTYCYHCDYKVKVGDRVIVDSPYHGYTAVTVVEVNVTIRNKAKKHVVCTIDDRAYKEKEAARERLAEIEKRMEDKKRETRAQMQERLLDEMLAHDPEMQQLKAEQEILNAGGRLVRVDLAELEKRVRMSDDMEEFIQMFSGVHGMPI